MILVLMFYETRKIKRFLDFARNDKTRGWNGSAYCVGNTPANGCRRISIPKFFQSVISV